MTEAAFGPERVVRRLTFWPKEASERLVGFASERGATLSTALSELVAVGLEAEQHSTVAENDGTSFEAEVSLHETPIDQIAVPVSVPEAIGAGIVHFANETGRSIDEAVVELADSGLREVELDVSACQQR